MAFEEVAGDLGRAALGRAQEAAHVGLELGDVDGAALAQGVGLDVLVEALGGVELGAVAGQEVQLDERRVGGDPVAHDAGAVSWVAVEDQHDLAALGVLDEALEEVQKQRAGEALVEDAEAQRAGVGDRGDHVRLEALAGALGHRGLTDRRPRTPGAVIAAQAGLVGPQDLGALPVGALDDLRVALLKPRPDGLVGLLVGAAHRLLRAQAPGAQVAPDRVRADLDAEALADQVAHQRPRPQKPGQLELIGVVADDQPGDLLLLGVRELGVPAAPAAPPGVKRSITAAPMGAHPGADRVGRHRQQPRDLDLRTTLGDQRDRPPAKLLLSGLRQRAGVPIHDPNTTRNTNYLLRQALRSASKSSSYSVPWMTPKTHHVAWSWMPVTWPGRHTTAMIENDVGLDVQRVARCAVGSAEALLGREDVGTGQARAQL